MNIHFQIVIYKFSFYTAYFLTKTNLCIINYSYFLIMADKVVILALVVVVAAAAATTPLTAQVICSPMLLAPCGPAMMLGQQPSRACCSQLVYQKPCLCQYKKSPALKRYVDSPNAKRIASTCNVYVSCP
ncbi:hypothetical protein RND81_14G230200 [Saponaria officinalis]|uniref:Bifunctional inhibitor/plant lipid transfer protein/seed storage helical domain-containing protein n=1 Tax=Saponaria officinalis TaxID=3572 RepID=A0AAW1GQD5_SAPOF